jgi:predicted Zn-ribbon and HTH transcriptional regulator
MTYDRSLRTSPNGYEFLHKLADAKDFLQIPQTVNHVVWRTLEKKGWIVVVDENGKIYAQITPLGIDVLPAVSIRYQTTTSNKRMTWAAAEFLKYLKAHFPQSAIITDAFASLQHGEMVKKGWIEIDKRAGGARITQKGLAALKGARIYPNTKPGAKHQSIRTLPLDKRDQLASEGIEMRESGMSYFQIALALGYRTDNQAQKEIKRLLNKRAKQGGELPMLPADPLPPVGDDTQPDINNDGECPNCKNERILNILRARSEKLSKLIDAVSAMVDAEDWLSG